MNLGFRNIPVEELNVDGYQRPIYPGHVKNIVENFDERLVNPLKVCWRDGRWMVWDGHHTLSSLKRKGYTEAPCLVTETISREEDAELFVKANNVKFSKRLTPYEDLNGRIFSTEKNAIDIEKIVNDAGFKLGNSSYGFNINAIRAIERIYNKYGGNTLLATLSTIRKTYVDEKKAKTATLIEGLAYFIHNFDGALDFQSLSRKMKKVNPESIINSAKKVEIFKGVKRYNYVLQQIYAA